MPDPPSRLHRILEPLRPRPLSRSSGRHLLVLRITGHDPSGPWAAPNEWSFSHTTQAETAILKGGAALAQQPAVPVIGFPSAAGGSAFRGRGYLGRSPNDDGIHGALLRRRRGRRWRTSGCAQSADPLRSRKAACRGNFCARFLSRQRRVLPPAAGPSGRGRLIGAGVKMGLRAAW
jgi:hypothetical protein